MLFSEVVGQQTPKSVIRQMEEGGRLPHAILLLGTQGVGTLPLALAISQYILCQNESVKLQKSDACGECNACQKVAKHIHPDVHYSFPTVGAKAISTQFSKEWRSVLQENPYLNVNQWLEKLEAENKQGNITKDECVDIFRKLSLKIFEGKKKILVMWLPEYLGKEGNRLLKLIEEPPDDTVFLLAAENSDLILNTILSRCQLIKLNPLQDSEISVYLQQYKGVAENEANTIAHLSDGNLNEALIIANKNEDDNAQQFLEFMRISYKGAAVEMVEWVEKTAGIGRERQKLFFRYGLHFLRELMMLHLTNGNAEKTRLQSKELETALRMMKIVSLEKIAPISHLFDNNTFHIERNANPKILFLNSSIQLNKILKGRS